MLTRWERAYQAFETPEEELRKLRRRLHAVGADRWDRGWRILEVCSGRGGGLQAWRSLGFQRVIGVDLSPALVSASSARSACIVGDARALPLASRSCDVAVVQGGLHHLSSTEAVEQAIREMVRVVRPAGRIVVIEPWLTPFLVAVHAVCRLTVVRRILPRIDALATMIEEERETYERWLRAPEDHLAILLSHVRPALCFRRWGKLVLVGSPKP